MSTTTTFLWATGEPPRDADAFYLAFDDQERPCIMRWIADVDLWCAVTLSIDPDDPLKRCQPYVFIPNKPDTRTIARWARL